MWKILVGFIAFAALALFILKKTGADIDMSGEKHGAEAKTTPATASAPAAASAAPVQTAGSAASLAASH